MNNPQSPAYDIAIIGGGIAGAGIARDAALRGFKVVLFEKNTFGSGTSSKSSKMIHGGIRYLEIAANALLKLRFSEAWKNLRFVFLALRETHILAKIAPDLVRPIPLVVPIYEGSGRSKWVVFAGSFLYFLLARITGPVHAPHILWDKVSLLKIVPNLNPVHLTGGVILWDHTTDDLELVKATLRSAVKNGAEAHEHTAVTGYSFDSQSQIYSLTVQKENQSSTVQARKVINASGPWIDKMRQAAQEKNGDWVVPVAGSHITFKQFVPLSVLLQAKDGRIFFVINRKNTSRVGTTEWLCKDPDQLTTPEEDVEYLLASLEYYFPEEKLEEKDILSKDSGIRPLAKPAELLPLNAISREHEIRISPAGVLHVLGVKLTDHRRAAEEIIDSLVHEMKLPHLRVKTRTRMEPLA